MARVAVIGAGLGGLGVALRLAAAGHAVTVLEQGQRVGGACGCHCREGFGFDTGPGLLTLPGVYRDLFADAGLAPEEALPAVPLDPARRFRFPDGRRLDLPHVSRPRIAAAWDDVLGEGVGADWSSLLTRAARIWTALRDSFLTRALEPADTLVTQALRTGDLAAVAPWHSLRELGRRHLHHPQQRAVLEWYALHAGADPRRAPAALVLLPYLEQTFGAWSLPGGLHRLPLAIAARATELGVRVRTGAGVAEVLLDAGRAAGVRLTDGERVPADLVVSAVDARTLYRDLLPRDVGAASAARWERGHPPSSWFVLLLALRGRTPDLPRHTVLLGPEPDAELDAVFGSGRHRGSGPRPASDPTLTVSAPDDPALRPEGHEAWTVTVTAPRHAAGSDRGVDWREPGLADRYADRLLAVLAERGLEVRHRVSWRQLRTPADLAAQTGSPDGAVHGWSGNGPRAAFLRPANRSAVPGLFLVGGSVHPGGGVPLVGLSARITAELIGPA